MKPMHKPGDLFKAHAARQKASGPIQMSGSFQGKSNTLGHGGRAAQLKARGVPGGVIGNLARAAQAAPGQKNYHGSKKKRKTAVIGTNLPAKKLPNTKNPSWVSQGPKSGGSPTGLRSANVNPNLVPKSVPIPSMSRFKKAKKRKIAATVAPKNFGKANQEAYAKQFGIVPQSSTRRRTKRKASGLTKAIGLAFKRKSAKKKALGACM